MSARADRRDDPRVAVVTGAASGIGRATAIALAGTGLRVAAADRDGTGARETARQAPGIHPYEVDVADNDSVRALATAVCSELGAPWGLVNCAGWDETHPFLETDAGFWEQVIGINLTGVVAMTHAFLAAMMARGEGRVINVASDAGKVGSSGEAVYAGAKGGVIAFTKSIARELARRGITANVVCPGPTDTPLFRAQSEPLRQALLKAIPMRRLGRPEDIAEAICFFASEGAAYITGQTLSVSGGLTMSG